MNKKIFITIVAVIIFIVAYSLHFNFVYSEQEMVPLGEYNDKAKEFVTEDENKTVFIPLSEYNSRVKKIIKEQKAE